MILEMSGFMSSAWILYACMLCAISQKTKLDRGIQEIYSLCSLQYCSPLELQKTPKTKKTHPKQNKRNKPTNQKHPQNPIEKPQNKNLKNPQPKQKKNKTKIHH